jgi:hypothetical protein
MDVDSETAFRAPAIAYILAQVAYMAVWMPRGVRAYKELERPIPITLKLNTILMIVQLLVLAMFAIGTIPSSSYIVALLLSLYFSGTSFVRVFVSIGQKVQSNW